MKKMTFVQAEIYRYLVEYVKENLYSPTIREIEEFVDLCSTSSVTLQLKQLESMGLIEIKKNEPRTIKLLGYSVVPNETLIRLYEDYARKNE